jgi:hypothetical protein
MASIGTLMIERVEKMRNMYMAWMGRIAVLLDSLQDFQLVIVVVRLLCDYDFKRHIRLVPGGDVSRYRPKREQVNYSSSRASQTVENDPKPSLFRIRYLPSLSVSSIWTGW